MIVATGQVIKMSTIETKHLQQTLEKVFVETGDVLNMVNKGISRENSRNSKIGEEMLKAEHS